MVWRLVLLFAFAAAEPSSAVAQAGVSVSASSQDIFRGLSISQGRPVADLGISYDGPAGVYAGAGVTGVDNARFGAEFLTYQADVGYAQRTVDDLTAEVGLSHWQFTRYAGGGGQAAHYDELYVGLAGADFSGRLYYSPDYLSGSQATLYGEVNGALRLAPQWRLDGHAGLLTHLYGATSSPTRFDLSLGLVRQFGVAEMKLAEIVAGPAPDVYDGRSHGDAQTVVGLTYAF